MVEMIQGFFKGDYLHHDIMATSLTLIRLINHGILGTTGLLVYRPLLARWSLKFCQSDLLKCYQS